MKTPKIMEEDGVPKPEGFDVSAYSNKVFQMFSGEETTVKLECDTSLMKYVIDRFGIDVETEELSEDKFFAKAPGRPEPNLLWLGVPVRWRDQDHGSGGSN